MPNILVNLYHSFISKYVYESYYTVITCDFIVLNTQYISHWLQTYYNIIDPIDII